MTPDRLTRRLLGLTTLSALLLPGCRQSPVDKETAKETARTAVVLPTPTSIAVLSPADVSTWLKYYPALDEKLFRQAYDLSGVKVPTRVLNFTSVRFNPEAAAQAYSYFESLNPTFIQYQDSVGAPVLVGPALAQRSVVFIVPQTQPHPDWPGISLQADASFKTYFDQDSALNLAYVRVGLPLEKGIPSIAAEDEELIANQGFMFQACESTIEVTASTQFLALALRRDLCNLYTMPLHFKAAGYSLVYYQERARIDSVRALPDDFYQDQVPQIRLPITRYQAPPSPPIRR